MIDQDFTSGFRRVIRDCIDLAELQFQLFSIDSQEARRKASTAAALAGTAAALGASVLTVLLVGFGFLLHEQAELPVGVSLLIVCGVSLFLIAILVWSAIRLIRTATTAMAETKSELAENLRWIKATILTPETSARNRFRSDSFAEPPPANGQFCDR
ncbi:hypothetical protein LF1_38830 [Rubripirellula obstinata]|uniref:Phage holin family protein n=1 Tax=Rubripirellula obstinata TaxID=406547 RepID=A0A5B1CLC5_9BACT|nr:phage holin family protein [Rubripirellula obstinata]KAA1261336.1 hypothetical protein LF1_38830 [Rubripirellula obstinata]